MKNINEFSNGFRFQVNKLVVRRYFFLENQSFTCVIPNMITVAQCPKLLFFFSSLFCLIPGLVHELANCMGI